LDKTCPLVIFYRRRAEQNFKLEKSCPQSQGALDWLTYVIATQNTFIHHAGNRGREKRVGAKRIPVDGFHVSSNTVYQFDGCYYHGCSCIETQDTLKKQELLLKAKRTKENHEYICGLGFHLIVMRECEWNKLKREDEQVRQFFLSQYTPVLNPRPMSSEQILDFVKTGALFGLLRVDIKTPDRLKEKFSEMCPIFKNVDISLDDIGSYMKQYGEEHGFMKQPRRSLISSYFGTNILLITPPPSVLFTTRPRGNTHL
jgi:hypothetical protein